MLHYNVVYICKVFPGNSSNTLSWLKAIIRSIHNKNITSKQLSHICQFSRTCNMHLTNVISNLYNCILLLHKAWPKVLAFWEIDEILFCCCFFVLPESKFSSDWQLDFPHQINNVIKIAMGLNLLHQIILKSKVQG